MNNITVNVLVSIKLRRRLFTVVQISEIDEHETDPGNKVKLIESHELKKKQDPVCRRCPKSLIYIQYLPFDLSIRKGQNRYNY